MVKSARLVAAWLSSFAATGCLPTASQGGSGDSGAPAPTATIPPPFDSGPPPSLGAPGDPCNGDVDCRHGSICWNRTCLEEGGLRFSLSWTVVTDFDLHVQTPSGAEIYFGERSLDGGVLDVDDCVGGFCRDSAATHVENVFFQAPPSGTYSYWVENYDGALSGNFAIEVAAAGKVLATQPGTLPAQNVDSTHFTLGFAPTAGP